MGSSSAEANNSEGVAESGAAPPVQACSVSRTFEPMFAGAEANEAENRAEGLSEVRTRSGAEATGAALSYHAAWRSPSPLSSVGSSRDRSAVVRRAASDSEVGSAAKVVVFDEGMARSSEKACCRNTLSNQESRPRSAAVRVVFLGHAAPWSHTWLRDEGAAPE